MLASFISASVSVGMVFLAWYTLAPLLGLTLERRSGDQEFGDYDPGYYSGYSYQQPQDPSYYYNYYQGRTFQERSGLLPRAAKMLLNR